MATIYRRSGSSIYQARLKVGDELRRVSTGQRDKRSAQETADRLEAEANRLIVRPGETTLIAASAKFFAEKTLRPNTVAGYKTSLANIVSKLGDFPLRVLTTKELKHYVNVRKRETGTVAIRRDLAFLSSLYKFVCAFDDTITSNPVRDFDKSGIPDAKERNYYLREEQFAALLQATPEPHHRLFLILAVETGMRSQEILQLRWKEVDFDQKLIFLGNLDKRRTKTGESRIIPLTNLALDTLTHTKAHCASEWVFVNEATGKPYTSFKKMWGGLRKRTGLVDIRIHDLRHTFASWAKQRGIPETTIMSITGHKTRSMVKRYSHDSIESLKRAAEAFERGTLSDTGSNDKIKA